MNGYRIRFTCPVYYNGTFSHNAERFDTFHAKDADAARARAIDTEETSREYTCGTELTVTVGREHVAEIEWLGTVHYKIVVEYVK